MKRWALAQHAVFHTLLCYFFFTFRFETPPHVFCSFSLSFLLVASSASYFRIIRPRLFFFLLSFFLYHLLSSSHTSLSLTSCTFIVNYSVQNRVIVRLAAVNPCVCVCFNIENVITCGRNQPASHKRVIRNDVTHTYRMGS